MIGSSYAAQIERAYVQKSDSDDQKKIALILAALSQDEWDALSIALVPYFGQAAEQSTTEAYNAIQSSFGVNFQTDVKIHGSFGQVNQAAVDDAKERAAEMVGKRLVNGELVDNPNAKWTITEPTREWLRKELVSAFADGVSPAKLTKLIGANPAFSRARAKMIAFTEVGNIHVRSHAASSKAMGAEFKASSLSADHDEYDTCDIAAEAGKIPIGENYPNGISDPLFHPRCHCAETFYWK